MAFKSLSSTFSVSPQPSEAEIALAAQDGFRAIIDSRQDGEEPGQLSAADMQALATSHGMGFAHIPTVPGKIGDEDVARMADAMAHLDGQILAYCRTGTRAASLWALCQAGNRSADSIIATASDAGYDLESLRSRLATGEIAPDGASPRGRNAA
jgi:sulfide:quinone oxidoreductase